MKKLKPIIVGFIIGSLFTMSTQTFAETAKNVVTAFLTDTISFEINGEKKELPQDYNILTYRDRTYVPVRFVAEEMGAEVGWDEASKTVKINAKENLLPELKEDAENMKEVQKSYKELPITKKASDMEIAATIVTREKDEWKVYFALENKSTKPIQLLQLETKIEVDEKTYNINDVFLYKQDARWYNDIREDEELEGYITLPKLHKDPKKMDLIVTVLINDRDQETHKFEFNILIPEDLGDESE